MLHLFARKAHTKPEQSPRRRLPVTAQTAFDPAEPTQLYSDPLQRCLQLERYGHLLANRRKWKDHPDCHNVCSTARERIDEMFAIVPEGFASLPQVINDEPGCEEITIETGSFLLARHQVTNARFQKFVDAGGYKLLELWPKEIWPHLIDFVDATNHQGPRFWRGGRHCKTLADHPVVGICFYEAAAYARWAGFRLPTEAEWQMAATWRIRSAANVLRRYPWGDSLDTYRCNIWSSGMRRTAPVHEFPDGAAPNQILQLVGNVWEWTACQFEVSDGEGGSVLSDMRMSAIRGGAFDTYFPLQATGFFRTGLVSLAREQNVGFRCALDVRKPKP
jgi:iron(II)-dependent oxidoreductase